MLIQLLGRDKCYAVEEPGYSKITAIYESNQVRIQRIGIDNAGLSVPELRRGDAQVVHISPTHHYPTGAVMPIGRRRELLRTRREIRAYLETALCLLRHREGDERAALEERIRQGFLKLENVNRALDELLPPAEAAAAAAPCISESA